MIKYTPKQLIGLRALKDRSKQYYMFDGGARSGKTFLLARYYILRAMMHDGLRQLVGRFRFNHAKLSVWSQTILPMLDLLKEDDRAISEHNGTPVHQGFEINHSDHIIKFDNKSEIWLAGFDEKERSGKVFGQEYGGIWVNEAAELSYNTFQDLKTRLNWTNIDLKFITDTNPRHPGHWLHKTFINHTDFETKKPLIMPGMYQRVSFSPYDNLVNLNPDFIKKNLETLTGVKRKRLLEGIWCESVEGAVFNFDRDVNLSVEPLEYIGGRRTGSGWDFGIQADVFIIWLQAYSIPITANNPRGLIINIFDEFVNNNQKYKFYADICKGKPYRDVEYVGDPSGTTRDSKLESWTSNLRSVGIPMQHPRKMTVADQIANTNDIMPCIRINEQQCPHVVEMFENWAHPKDKDGKVVENSLPVHDEYSHPGTALNYIINKMFPLRKSAGGVYFM